MAEPQPATPLPGTFREYVVGVGQPQPLNGVLCAATTPRAGAPMVLILNSGLLHHVGSCGLSVKLARALASEGLSSFRFDFSGIGDSPARRSRLPYEERTNSEVLEVMDYLQRHRDARSFILYGLCSGAFASFAVACQDARVRGVAQIAPHTYRTWKWYPKHYLPKLFSLAPYRKRLRALAGKGTEASETPTSLLEQLAEDDSDVPPRTTLAAGYRQLLARNTPLFVLMTRGENDTYNYLGQFRDMLPDVDFGELLTERHYPRTRHIITEPDDQAAIVAELTAWMVGVAERS